MLKKTNVIISILGLLVLSTTAYAGWYYAVADSGGTCADSTCDGFLICQNFEGTGYDNGETPTENVGDGTIDPDYTTDPGRGSQSIELTGSASYSSIYWTISTGGTVDIHFMVKIPDTTPTGTTTIYTDSGNYSVQLLSNGNIRLYHGSAYTSTVSPPFTDDTWAHVWIHLEVSTGADDGVYQLYVAPDRYKPETPIISGSNGNRTGNPAGVMLRGYLASAGIYFDQVLVSTSVIGDVCE